MTYSGNQSPVFFGDFFFGWKSCLHNCYLFIIIEIKSVAVNTSNHVGTDPNEIGFKEVY